MSTTFKDLKALVLSGLDRGIADDTPVVLVVRSFTSAVAVDRIGLEFDPANGTHINIWAFQTGREK